MQSVPRIPRRDLKLPKRHQAAGIGSVFCVDRIFPSPGPEIPKGGAQHTLKTVRARCLNHLLEQELQVHARPRRMQGGKEPSRMIGGISPRCFSPGIRRG
jgi:hypothetical protein